MEGMARLFAAFLAFVLLCPGSPHPSVASGRAEKPASEELARLTILVVRQGSSSSAPSLSTTLPMEIAPYLWNAFSVRGGAVETDVDGRYRIEGSMGTSSERVDSLEIGKMEFRAASPGRPGGKPTSVRVAFDLSALLSADGQVLLQPGQYALMQAVRDSGRASGEARGLSVRRSGARRFTAEVLLR